MSEVKLLREPTDAKIEKEWEKTLAFYEKKETEGYQVRDMWTKREFIKEYKKRWQLENKARKVGGHEYPNKTIGESMRSSLVVGSKQGGAVSKSFLKEYSKLTPEEKQEMKMKFREIAAYDLDKMTSKELEMAIRKDRALWNAIFEINDVRIGKIQFHWEVHS
jgi:hypothetical protein